MADDPAPKKHAKYLKLDDEVYSYIAQTQTDIDTDLLEELRSETHERLPGHSMMQISVEQCAFLRVLVAALNINYAVEIGTFTGASALCISRGLAPGGTLHCHDQSTAWTDIARSYWLRAGVADRIELHIGQAIDTIKQHVDQTIDLVFIDADKTNYDAYYETLLPAVKPGGLILFDNMLWGGSVARDPATFDDNAKAIAALNRKLVEDPRVDTALIPVSDGIHLVRKL